MTRWTRTPNATLCGGCNSPLAKGAAVVLRKLSGVKREFTRGECCAGAAPPDLSALREPGEPPITFSFTQAADALPHRTRGSLKTLAKEYLPYRDDE